MISPDALRGTDGFILFIEVARPFHRIPVLRVQHLDNTRLVEWPAIHVRIQTFVGNRANQEGFALFPRFASRDPGVAGCFERRVARTFAERVYGFEQGCVFIPQILVSRQDNGIDKLFGYGIQLSIVLRISKFFRYIRMQLVQQATGQLHAFIHGGYGFLAVDIVAERLGNSLDRLGRFENQGLDFLVQLRIDRGNQVGKRVLGDISRIVEVRVRGVCIQVAIHLVHIVVVDASVVSVADGEDVVRIVVAGMPAIPRFHGVETAFRVAAGVFLPRVFDFGVAHFVGNVPHSAFYHLLDASQGTAICAAGLFLEKRGIRAFPFVIFVPIAVQVFGVLVEQHGYVVHVVTPGRSVVGCVIQIIRVLLFRFVAATRIWCRVVFVRASAHCECQSQR